MLKPVVVTSDRMLIGIDVGWSLKRRTCAMATQGIQFEWAKSTLYLNPDNDAKNIRVSLFTLKELTDFLPHFLQTLQEKVQQIILVVDGPVGPDGPPERNRHVDQACAREGFRGRAQPSPVEGDMGSTYVAATYSLIRSFLGAAKNAHIWLGGVVPSDRLVVAETHPTVAMALMLPPQDPTRLPTRKHSIRVEERVRGRVIRAKSDWYWRLGVNKQVERILGVKGLAEVCHHERVAGLFCLAIAAQLGARSADNSSAMAIGAADGIYVVPQVLDVGWRADVHRVGLVSGTPSFEAVTLNGLLQNEPIAPLDTRLDDDGEADSDEYGKGDNAFSLVLADNGGVWENHNDWLIGLEPKIILKALNGDCEELVLEMAKRSKQWKIAPTALDLARSRGFTGKHLSLDHAIALPVQ